MVIRPVDEDGDILPVLSPVNVLKGVRAETELIRERLHLLTGDWWENRSWGNMIVELLKQTRYTEADQQLLASYLSSYIRETPGVQDIRDMAWSVSGRQFRFSCIVETESGSTEINYSI